MTYKKYRVLLVELTDPHFRPDPPQEIYSSDILKNCEDFCKAYLKDNGPGFYGLKIEKQIMSWEEIKTFV